MFKYDKRMNPWDNFRFGVWLPLVCRILGHKIVCYKVVPTTPQKYFYWCHRCMDMTSDRFEPCGRCDNGCPDS